MMNASRHSKQRTPHHRVWAVGMAGMIFIVGLFAVWQSMRPSKLVSSNSARANAKERAVLLDKGSFSGRFTKN